MRSPSSARVAFAATVAVLVALSPSLAGEEPPASALDREYEETVAKLFEARRAIPAGENAADDYARAFEALPARPDGADNEEGGLDWFFTTTALYAAPEALREFPGAVDEVRKYREAVTVHLRRAVSRQRCMFDLDWKAGAGMLMPHLAKARDLARRAVLYGKLRELEEHPREAARVYLDIIRMGLHLDRDPTLISILVGMAVVELAGLPLEGFLAREPDALTARLVFEGLQDLPRERFDAARAIDFERILMGGWMRAEFVKLAEKKPEEIARDFEAAEGVFALLGFGADAHAPWQVPRDPKAFAREVAEAFGVYDGHMRAIAAAMAGPYHETRAKVAEIEKLQTAYWDGEKKAGRLAAGVVGVVVAPVVVVRARMVRAEARLRGLEILAAAALAKAERGEYPADLDGLKGYFPGGAPADPFTGRPFAYWLAEGMPAVQCEADDPELEEKKPDTYHFGLLYRLALEKQALDKWRAERKQREEERGGDAPPEPQPDEVW